MRTFPSNNDRASWANTAVSAFIVETGDAGDEASNIQDLICDLMHLCDAYGFDFHDLVERGHYHYLVEIGAPGAERDWGTDEKGKADAEALNGKYGQELGRKRKP